AADELEPVALPDELVELLLVAGGGHAVPGQPRRTGTLLPDGGVAVSAADAEAADEFQPVAWPAELVDRLLVAGRGHAVASDPRRTGTFLPDGGVVLSLGLRQ